MRQTWRTEYNIFSVAIFSSDRGFIFVAWVQFTQWHLRSVLQVKVILGDDRERTGTLINIDAPDGIIKMDQTEQLKILPLKYLAKMGPTNI